MRSWSVVLLAPVLLAGGCWSAGDLSPAAGSAPATQAAEVESTPAAAPAEPRIDDDSDADPPNPVAEAMLAPVRAIGNGFAEMFALPADAIKKAQGDTPSRAVHQMEDKASADNRRNGMNRLLEYPFTNRPPYTKVYESMAALDEDYTVRATALRACNRSRDKTATPLFIKALSETGDGDSRQGAVMIRLEGAKGLANLPDPNAIPALTAVVNNPDENRDVRIAATDALKYYRTLEVARILSGLLNDPDFSVGWQAHRSLEYLTHKDFGYDQGAWLGYFVGPQKPFG
ncbi:MAG TPA: HEAT repeat domain-containing protein [Tepidisphaeraceae bacterium]|jgi:hypothetical protein